MLYTKLRVDSMNLGNPKFNGMSKFNPVADSQIGSYKTDLSIDRVPDCMDNILFFIFGAVVALIQVTHLSKSYEDVRILDDISLTVEHGEFLTLLGPSGCGKTTLLNLIAGFDTPDEGEIAMHGQRLNDVPPQKRSIHTVFQNYALFPHLNVFDNIAFGLRCRKTPADEISERVNDALELVKLADYSTRKPAQLSGGQQQRVAIARAIIANPSVLLLDEPLSSLDYRLRKSMQYELKQLQRRLKMTFIFVTHDQEEALSVSDRIAVFHRGKIQQIGTPREIYETPVNLTVANFIGETNVIDCDVLSTKETQLTIAVETTPLVLKNSQGFKQGDKVHFIIRPEDIRVWGEHEVENTQDMIQAKIVDILYKGSTVDLKVELPSGNCLNATEFFDEDDEDLEYEIGQKVWIHWLSGWEVLLPYEQ